MDILPIHPDLELKSTLAKFLSGNNEFICEEIGWMPFICVKYQGVLYRPISTLPVSQLRMDINPNLIPWLILYPQDFPCPVDP